MSGCFLMGSITRLIEHHQIHRTTIRHVTCLFIKMVFLLQQKKNSNLQNMLKINIQKNMCFCLFFKPKHPLFIIPTDTILQEQKKSPDKLVFLI